MRRTMVGAIALAVVGVGAAAVVVAGRFTHSSCAPASQEAAAGACEAPSGESTNLASKGKASGAFDPVMSSVCRFSCATQLDFDPKELAPQPGARTGQLTRCPVSGVVFAVAGDRPRVQVAGKGYVLCCDRCAEKLRANPGRFLSL